MRTSPSSLSASTAGSSFPDAAFAFTVHSIFPRAANLRPSDGAYLLSLVSDSAKAHPRGAVVPEARFDEWELFPGDAGSCDGSLIRFAGNRRDAPVVLLPRSRVPPADEGPSCRKRTGAATPSAAERASFLRPAAVAVEALRAERGAEPSLAELFGTAVPEGNGFAARFVRAALELEAAAAALSVPLLLGAARSLAGFGPGLTPAGDDFLCGWLAGQRSRAADDLSLDDFLDAWGRSAFGTDGLAGRTNDISAAFLADAVEGRFGAALVAFADAAIGTAAGDAIEHAVAVLGSLGHSSGTDAAAGFLFAYRLEIGG